MAIDLSTITAGNGSRGFVLRGAGGDKPGWSVASAGDVNGDGFDDLIVGAPYADGPADSRNNAGDSYVVFGKAGGFTASIDLARITGSDGFVLHGERTNPNDAYGYSTFGSGYSVASAGDVNGDGFDDVIVGAPFSYERSNAGDSYVVFGKASGFAAAFDLASITAGDGSRGFVLWGEQANDFAGDVASAGDVNGDGFDDLIVGASHADGPADSRDSAGESYVVFGKAAGFAATIELASIAAGDGSQGFVLWGEQAGDTAADVASAGDVNGDGFADLIVGATDADGPADTRDRAGDSYVVFGKAGGFGASIDLASITAGNGSRGFVLQGELAGDASGWSVASAGDVNGDGFDDVIVGAQLAGGPAGTRNRAGDSYVVFGKASGFAGTLDLASITAGDGSKGFVLQGARADDRSGWSVACARDVNGDGFDDLIVGAPRADGPADGRSEAGDSYVIFGKARGFGATIDLSSIAKGNGGFVIYGELEGHRSGGSVASAGDVNGDGFDDLIVGRRTGADSYVIFGSDTIGGSASRLTQPAGGSADNKLTGSAATADVLVGGRGDDTLSGGGGADALRGAEGNDILSIANAGFVRVSGGTGLDSLSLQGAMSLGDSAFCRMSDLEAIILGNQSVSLTLGPSAAQAFGGVAATDFRIKIDGTASISAAQTVDAANFNQGLTIDFTNNSAGVTVVGGMRDSSLRGGRGEDDLRGNAGNDTLTGGRGSDFLDGSIGADTMKGGGGDDNYIVDDAGDQTVEAAGAGIDAVRSSVTFTLGFGLNNLTLTGTDAVNGTGNELLNLLIGNAAANKLNGGSGTDTVECGAGADTAVGGGGNDTLGGGNGNDVLNDGAGRDTLNGDLGNDRIAGGADNDTIAGGQNNDTLGGGSGHDTFVFASGFGDDSANGGGGVDVLDFRSAGPSGVIADLRTGNATLGANSVAFSGIETVLGTVNADRLIGNDADNWLTAFGANDFIHGGSGNDTVVGGAGNDTVSGALDKDTLSGGAGRDIFDFNTINYSAVGAQRDIVTDFIAGTPASFVDRIDLSGIDANFLAASNQEFIFIGTAAFALDTPGRVRYFQSGAVTIVALNTDNDAQAEMHIELAGLIDFFAQDFVL